MTCDEKTTNWPPGVRCQGSQFFSGTKLNVFSRLFPGKSNKIPGQFNFESTVCTDYAEM